MVMCLTLPKIDNDIITYLLKSHAMLIMDIDAKKQPNGLELYYLTHL